MPHLHPRIARTLRRLDAGKTVQTVALQLVHARVLEKPVTFCVNMENDPIQRHHRKGTFYESNELQALSAIFSPGGVFVDIGAKVGNHTMLAAQHLGASTVIPFEPNPQAFELLLQNVVVNGLRGVVDLSMLGIGLSNRREGGYAIEKRTLILGGARMLEGEGDLDLYRGDDSMPELRPDIIEIDVEAMELLVLEGLSGILDRYRLVLLVEIDVENDAAFAAWMDRAGYAVAGSYQRYKSNRNHIVADRNRVAEVQERLAA